MADDAFIFCIVSLSRTRIAKMIIDTRTVFETNFGRPLTFSAAVAEAIDSIGVHEALTVEKAIGPNGQEMSRSRLSMMVTRHKGDRVFTVRQSKDDNILATITRLK